MEIRDLRGFGASERLIEVLSGAGIKSLFPPQIEALEAGLLNPDVSLVVSAPTASGKTLIAEMAALETFFTGKGKTLYLVPLRALAREKYDDLVRKYAPHGIKIAVSTGDLDSSDPWLKDSDIIIATNEKIDSVLRHRAQWAGSIRTVVADEVHLIGDSSRGPTLEVVLTRLRLLNQRTRFIALSATIPNSREIASWLGAKLVYSEWRPIPLKEGVFCEGVVEFSDGTRFSIHEESDSDAVNLALDTIEGGGQALIFVNSRKSAEAVALKAGEWVRTRFGEEAKRGLVELQKDALRAVSEPTRTCRKLAECIADGVAFHHAGVRNSQRKLAEDAFRANRIKLLVATTTLAMGLNLPSRRVIIRDWWRYESGLGMTPLPAIEIKQMSGRAGRPGYDPYGEAVVIVKSRRDEQRIFDRYINGPPEEVDSQLGFEQNLRTHVLSSIASSFCHNKAELREFLRSTLSASQRGVERLIDLADGIIEYLESEGMITVSKKGYSATRFGRRVSDLYLDPYSGVIIRDALHRDIEKTDFGLLYMLSETPDMMTLSLKKKDYDEYLEVFGVHSEGLLISEDERIPSEEVLSNLKTASAMMQWIKEAGEEKITSHFGIGPGDLRTLIELGDWLLYSSAELCKVFDLKDELKKVSLLRIRVKNGIKEELVELVALRGIGRVRARALHDAGFQNLRSIREADASMLSLVPSVGPSLAESIKKQAGGASDEPSGEGNVF